MKKRSIITAGVASATVLLGAGTAAYATGSLAQDGGAPSTTQSTTAKKAHHKRPLARAAHATWVTRGGKKVDHKFVTHDKIRGTVTSASSSSITVKAADGFTQTYRIDAKSTKVHDRADKSKGANSSISKVRPGLNATVIGTGAADKPTANSVHFWVPKKSQSDKSSDSSTS